MHPFFRNMRHRATVIIAVLAACAVASLIFSGMIGSIAIPLADMPSALLHLMQGKTDTLAATLLDLRLGRALTAFVTGAALSLAAGAVVNVVALSTGHMLVMSGKAIAFIPNELGKALLHHSKV